MSSFRSDSQHPNMISKRCFNSAQVMSIEIFGLIGCGEAFLELQNDILKLCKFVLGH